MRESNYFVQSFFTNETFDPDEIQTFTELHHENIVDPNLKSDDSLYIEFNPMQISNKNFLFDNVWNDILQKEKQRYEDEMLIKNGGHTLGSTHLSNLSQKQRQYNIMSATKALENQSPDVDARTNRSKASVVAPSARGSMAG